MDLELLEDVLSLCFGFGQGHDLLWPTKMRYVSELTRLQCSVHS
jgi:hypothetical protein